METELASQDIGNAAALDYETVVERYYRSLFQFAVSLTRSEADACDLTQHVFYTWSIKGGQLRDPTKIRSWLFTTLHRAFLERKRRETRFPHFELHLVDGELPCVYHDEASSLDAADVMRALNQVDDVFRAPLALFYLEDCPYKDIALALNIPLGTVKSRIARGIMQLKALILEPNHSLSRIAA
jgi:RNA polymerase sigma-70 factor, ECF subfamily